MTLTRNQVVPRCAFPSGGGEDRAVVAATTPASYSRRCMTVELRQRNKKADLRGVRPSNNYPKAATATRFTQGVLLLLLNHLTALGFRLNRSPIGASDKSGEMPAAGNRILHGWLNLGGGVEQTPEPKKALKVPQVRRASRVGVRATEENLPAHLFNN